MSKCMQLTVTVRPHYQKGFEETYPKLAEHLGRLDPDLVKRNPSLFELAGQLDHLLYRFEGTRLREVLLRHRDLLLKTHNSIRESMADWNLSRADRLLYVLEDAFNEMESDLD